MWIERGQSAPELDTSAVSRRDLVRRALTVVVTLALAGCRDSGADSRSGRGASPPSRSRQTDVRPTEAGRSDTRRATGRGDTRRATGRGDTRRAAPSSRGSRPSDDRTRGRAPES